MIYVQDSWEAMSKRRQLLRSQRWDTNLKLLEF